MRQKRSSPTESASFFFFRKGVRARLFFSFEMAVIASGMLAAAVVLLAASTAGRERSDCDRGSAERDRSCAEAERSTNRLQDMNYDMICNIPSYVNCSLRWNRKRRVPSGAHEGRQLAERDRVCRLRRSIARTGGRTSTTTLSATSPASPTGA